MSMRRRLFSRVSHAPLMKKRPKKLPIGIAFYYPSCIFSVPFDASKVVELLNHPWMGLEDLTVQQFNGKSI
jgi:hypothetical protein